ncbi:putative Ig domain-containing protein [Mesorhizobium sp. UC74_2]|uniref:putative Ig domain-containing protein n=1 Tax=Mesorhizobium sp. UC74_2 TaxID=3350171 RepID=UPI00366DFE63
MRQWGIDRGIALFGLASIVSFVLMALMSAALAASTTTSLIVSPERAMPGQTVTLMATVMPVIFSGGPWPTGKVRFLADGALLGEVDLAGSMVAISPYFTAPPPGLVSLKAEYSGDGIYASSNASHTLAVKAFLITTPTLRDGVAGEPYNQGIAVGGGSGNYTFSMTGGPAGLNLSAAGVLSGTPVQTGSFSIAVTAKDNASGDSDSRSFIVRIGAPTISIHQSTLPTPVLGTAYSQFLTAAGGVGPYIYSISSGALPAGLQLSTEGKIEGTPTEAGDFSFTIVATDNSTGAGAPFAGSQSYSLKITAPTITIAPSALSRATAGTSYNQTLTASGGTAPYGYDIGSGQVLPKGLFLAPDGTLGGTATETGMFSFDVVVKDRYGSPATRNYTLTVGSSPITGVLPNTLTEAMAGTPYNQAFTASGGLAPYTFSRALGSSPPPGLKVSADGILSGTPTKAGHYAFSIVARDSGTSSWIQRLTLVVKMPTIAITPDTLPNATGGSAYDQPLSATGGGAPYSFAVSDGALPVGLSLKADGRLSGTPGVAGSFAFTVKVTDANSYAATQAYTLTVSAPLPVAKDISVDLLAGTSARANLTSGAVGGPFTAAAIVAAPAAASGMARVDANSDGYDLVFESAATASGAVAVSYTLSNRWGVSVPATVTFNIAARPDPAQDPEVTGLIAAQMEAASRLAASQTRNFNGRLEQLHDEGQRHANSVGIQLGLANGAKKPLGYTGDERDRQQSVFMQGFPMDRLDGKQGDMQNAMAFWAGGFINFGQRDGAIDIRQTLAGISGGVDYRFSPRFVGGVGFGYGRDSADIGDKGTRSEASALSVAAYGSYSPLANVFIDGLLGYSRLDFESRRFVTPTGDFATGGRDGQQLFGSLTTAYEHQRDGWLLSPYGRLEASWSRLDSYTEISAGSFSLVYGEQSLTTLAGVLGLRAQYAVATTWGVFTPKARLEYTHDFSGSSRASVGYADLGNGLPYGFDVEGSVKDRLGIGLGFDAGLDNGWLLGLDYSTALAGSGSGEDHTVAVRIGSRW